MSAVATVIGLTVATTTAAIVLMKYINKEFMSPDTNDTINEIDVLLDPDGPAVQFVLFLRDTVPINLKIGQNKTLRTSGFNFNQSTKIVTHGFRSSIRFDVFVIVKDAYLESGDYNVIGMDWSVLCGSQYGTAIKGVETTGKTLTRFINWLNTNGLALDKIHLIGHSLGAHVVGIGGYNLKNGRVARITGLDPAGPGYGEKEHELKLDSGDAELVDVIHTYISVLGLAQPLGHIDFYPNGGKFQPGCPDIYEIFKVSESFLCNHGRSYQLFAESIRNKYAFRSNKCKSVQEALTGRCSVQSNVYMGQPDTYRKGLYYLKTRGQKPYSIPKK